MSDLATSGKIPAVLLLSLLLGACASQPEGKGEAAAEGMASTKPTPTTTDEEVDANAKLVLQSLELIQAKKPAQALPLAQQAVAEYEKRYRQSGGLSFSSRSLVETLAYLAQAASANTPAQVHGPWWGFAHFAKGFALVDLYRISEAKEAFETAIHLSPQNSKYLSERGNIDALEKNWRASFDRFKQALEAAALSPEQVKTSETTRALRGMAYAEIELGNLDAAKALHERVLALDPANAMSRSELRYLQNLKNRAPNVGAPASIGANAGAPAANPDPRFAPEAQARALISLWQETCLKHYGSPLTLRAAMVKAGSGYVENPPNAASFLKGEPGTVWDVSSSVYSQRVLVLLDNGFCEIRAQRASAKNVDAAFAQSVEALAAPGVMVRKLSDGQVPDYGGPLRKTVYWVKNEGDGRIWHFGSGTTDSLQAATQAVLAVSPEGARLKNKITFPAAKK
ncbi:tetratricopeptide repeat protein [Variovorax sp. LT1R20]|uniref:tetratricopeptide repeat protein n=1 Tax=Variovorax sp. LT1R20 TaxID=3443729 RepID=UPI003F44986F